MDSRKGPIYDTIYLGADFLGI